MTPLLQSMQAQFAALPSERVDALGRGDARRTALAAALAAGLPGARAESWKYTSLRALAARSFVGADVDAPVDAATLAHIAAPRMVFVNGRFDADLSDFADLPPGIEALPQSHARALGHRAGVLMLGAQREFAGTDHVFSHVNAALADEGAFVSVDDDVAIDTPFNLVFVGAPTGTDVASHLHHLVVLGNDAKLTLVEHHIGAAPHRNLCNQHVHVHVGHSGELRHVRLQEEDVGATLLARTDVVLVWHALYRRVDLELGAGLSRHELNIALRGDHALAIAGGVLVGDGRRHVDTRLTVEHEDRDTRCELPWRGLANDRARVAFHGGITIRAGADGSDANLSSRNLLLSDAAEIDTQPVLVIHADEVKAAHGATVGRLDDTALFYLRSRGLAKAEAQRLLEQAFLREPLAVLQSPPLAEFLGGRLAQRLARREAE